MLPPRQGRRGQRVAEFSKTADQALTVLEAVAEEAPIGIAALARHLNLHRSIVHRLVETLYRRGYLRRTGEGYVVGEQLIRLAGTIEPRLLVIARPVLARLAQAHRETFILSGRDGGDAVLIAQAVRADQMVRAEFASGFRHPLQLGAGGRAILAYLDPAAIERASAAAADPALLHRQLAEIRAQGYAISGAELAPDLHAVSAPVWEKARVTASLGVVLPATRAARVAELIAAVVAAAHEISLTVGGATQE